MQISLSMFKSRHVHHPRQISLYQRRSRIIRTNRSIKGKATEGHPLLNSGCKCTQNSEQLFNSRKSRNGRVAQLCILSDLKPDLTQNSHCQNTNPQVQKEYTPVYQR